jgi:hypothetical protein
MMITFSNPRQFARIEDWPYGGNKRGPCVFQVESHPKRGQRVSRTTTGKPKYTTYADQGACIVDGSNGKTYILLAGRGSVSIFQSDMQHIATTEELGFDHLAWVRSTDIADKNRLYLLLSLVCGPTARHWLSW